MERGTIFTFLAEPIVIILVDWPRHAKICQLDHPARVDEAIPAGHVPVHILEVGQVCQTPGHVQCHRGQAAVGHLVIVLTVQFVHQVASEVRDQGVLSGIIKYLNCIDPHVPI